MKTNKNKSLFDEELNCKFCFVKMKRNLSPHEINDMCKSNIIQWNGEYAVL